MANYTLDLNCYGNVNGIPDGWREVSQTARTLKAAKIPFYKACTGFVQNGKYAKPILVNIIPCSYKGILTKYLNGQVPRKKKTEAEKITAWCKRLAKLANITIEEAEQIAEEKRNYQENQIRIMENRQCSSYSVKRGSLIRKMQRENPLRRIVDVNHALAIVGASERHADGSYDGKLEKIHELEKSGLIEKGNARELARSSRNIDDILMNN